MRLFARGGELLDIACGWNTPTLPVYFLGGTNKTSDSGSHQVQISGKTMNKEQTDAPKWQAGYKLLFKAFTRGIYLNLSQFCLIRFCLS